MAWEHALLGDLAPAQLQALNSPGGDPERISAYCAQLEKLGRGTGHTEAETIRLPGSGLVVTLGELNILAD